MTTPDTATSGRTGSVRIVMYFLVFGLVLVAVAGLGVWYAKTTAERYARADSQKDAQFAADGVNSTLAEGFTALQQQLATTAQAPTVARAIADPTGCTLSFTGLGPISSGHIDFLAVDGAVRCSSAPRPGTTDYVGAAWLPPVDGGYSVIGPTKDSATGKWVSIALQPLPDHTGFVAVFLDLDTLGPGLGQQFAGRRNLEIIVTTSDGKQIVSRSVDARRDGPAAARNRRRWRGSAPPVRTPTSTARHASTVTPSWPASAGTSTPAPRSRQR